MFWINIYPVGFLSHCLLKYINLSNKAPVQYISRLCSHRLSDLSNVVPVPNIHNIYSQVKKVGPMTIFNQHQSDNIIPQASKGRPNVTLIHYCNVMAVSALV